MDARGLAVAPGFINLMSWHTSRCFVDGRGQSDVRQGVTLEVFGEGDSMGPLSDSMKVLARTEQGDLKFPVTWTTLGEGLDALAAHGVSPNVASFVGAATVRVHELGWDDRAPSAAELARMQSLVRQAMDEGALGVASALIYAPGFYAKTPELIALARAAAPRGRHLHLAHAERGRPAARGNRRVADDRSRSAYPRRDLPPQGRRRSRIGERWTR